MRLTLRLLFSSVVQKRPFFVSTPIFYVNAAPHLGHLYSAVVADAIQRFEKLTDPHCNVLFSTGTDEHGTKIQQAASKAGQAPADYCSTISEEYRRLFAEYNVEHTDFVRTTEDRHKKAVAHFWNELVEGGHIYKAVYSGWYSVSDESFVPEAHTREVLQGGRKVKVSAESGHEVEWTEEPNYMFRLSAFRGHLQRWLRTGATSFVPGAGEGVSSPGTRWSGRRSPTTCSGSAPSGATCSAGSEQVPHPSFLVQVKVSAESGHEVEWTEEPNYMFRLSAFRGHLQRWLRTGATSFVPGAGEGVSSPGTRWSGRRSPTTCSGSAPSGATCSAGSEQVPHPSFLVQVKVSAVRARGGVDGGAQLHVPAQRLPGPPAALAPNRCHILRSWCRSPSGATCSAGSEQVPHPSFLVQVKVSAESGHEVEWTEEPNYMFRLSAFRGHLQRWLRTGATSFVPGAGEGVSSPGTRWSGRRSPTTCSGSAPSGATCSAGSEQVPHPSFLVQVKVSAESGHEVEWTEEPNYMFRLSAFRGHLQRWLRTDGVIMPSKFQKQLQEQLERETYFPDISVSRPASRVHWAIRVPGDEEQSIYVWLDALVNYLTATGYPEEQAVRARGRAWPADVHVVGKDILKFHGLYWPAFLMAARRPPPRRLVCHAHWTRAGLKMSKSKGNVLCPRTAPVTGDALRYFLLREGTLHSDANYSETKLINIVNSELADTLGNLVSRCCGAALNPRGEFPALHEAEAAQLATRDVTQALLTRVERLPDQCREYYATYQFYRAVDEAVAALHACNLFFEALKPWELRKENRQRELDVVLHLALETLRVSAIVLQPVIPQLAGSLLDRLQIPPDCRSWRHCETASWRVAGAIPETKRLRGGKFVLFPRVCRDNKPAPRGERKAAQ
ncbi:methionine--tRNA ligase, mitochondrial [Cydia pomonella]|uniref:methionine--tRNA ligase, mitochondrial n=1 Tax=Cydia pomonella TaxID=82600 RepID=UPI002ADDDBB5|nr:methionine--tRNA ligase, mitochondrial [Cydia pomonella]